MSPPHGGVDRNCSVRSSSAPSSGRPHTGAWIETGSKPGRSRDWMVAPTRGRGSKLGASGVDPRRARQVAPTRGRGSKRGVREHHWLCLPRRPHTGAWIETGVHSHWRRCGNIVAPTRGRGSKHLLPKASEKRHNRRPHTGAWIETGVLGLAERVSKVAPTRGRGSKLACHGHRAPPAFVAPTRGRGSKLQPFRSPE